MARGNTYEWNTKADGYASRIYKTKRTARNYITWPTSDTGINSYVFTLGSILTSTELTAFQELYSQYQIDKIVLNFQQAEFTASDAYNQMWVRYNYDWNFPAGGSGPTLLQMQDMKDVKFHTFTPEAPAFSYTIYPKLLVPGYFNPAGVTPGTTFGGMVAPPHPISLGDTDSTSFQHWGLVVNRSIAQNAVGVDVTIFFKVWEDI